LVIEEGDMIISNARRSGRVVTQLLTFVIGGFLNIGAPVEASAQSRSSSQEATSAGVATSFAELAALVQPGAVIRVTDVRGRTASGTLGQVSKSSFELLKPKSKVDGRDAPMTPQVWSERDVQSIELERRDSLLNGTLIGLAVGGLGGLLGGAANCRNYSCQAGPVAAASGALFAGIGAGVGALTDLAINGRTTVYQAPQRSSGVRVSPVTSTSSLGVLLSVRF
jgi:hypothetical protein